MMECGAEEPAAVEQIPNVLAWLAFLAAIGSPAEAARLPSPIAGIRALPEEEAARPTAVFVRGVVTFTDRGGRIFTVQDDSAGIWFSVTLARAGGEWQGDDAVLAALAPGCLVEVEGATVRGGFAPAILPRSIRILDRRPLPTPAAVVTERFFSGSDDCLRVEVSGVAQGFIDDGSRWLLVLERQGRRFEARVPKAAFADPETTVVDAAISLVGVATAKMNARGEILYPRLLVNNPADVRITTPPASSPFAAPKVPLRAIAHFQPEPLGGHRLRTEGIVSYAVPGQFFHVQDGFIGVRVQTRRTEPLAAGDRVEIAGFLDRRRATAGIIEALYRVVGREEPPQPVAIPPARIVELTRQAYRLGLMADPGDYDGCAITFPARLLEISRTQNGGLFVLSADGMESSVVATAGSDVFATLQSLRPGSDLQVSGILQVESTARESLLTTPDDERLMLRIRTPADVQVLRAPSWWTAPRLAMLLAGLAAVFAGSLAWVMLLRREVATQAGRLAGEMRKRRDAAVEFHATLRERSRLAANLHDTLLQVLAGIGLQLDVCRRSLLGRRLDDTAGQLDIAKRMVRHASADLRGSVWALRTAPTAGRSFAESMEALVEHLGEQGPARVTLHTEGPPFEPPQFVAGNLMLIAQEAVRNALNHARANAVAVTILYADAADAVTVSVADDGTGFALDDVAGVDQGHFGLQGMRERAEGLGGAFTLDSRPGLGTRVSAHVVVQAHDTALDGADSDVAAGAPLA
jgi:signal transduction histidine kinase